MAKSGGDGAGREHACAKRREHRTHGVCADGRTTARCESIAGNTARAAQGKCRQKGNRQRSEDSNWRETTGP